MRFPSQPWIDGTDLRRIVTNPEAEETVYQWRDSNTIVVINDKTNEIVDVYESRETIRRASFTK